MRVATAPTGCSPRKCSPRTTACQGTAEPPRRALVPTGARRSPPHRRRAHHRDRQKRRRHTMAHDARHGLSHNGHGAVDRDRLREEIHLLETSLALLAGPVAPHAGPVGPRHAPRPDPADDRPAAPGTRPQAGLRAALKCSPQLGPGATTERACYAPKARRAKNEGSSHRSKEFVLLKRRWPCRRHEGDHAMKRRCIMPRG